MIMIEGFIALLAVLALSLLIVILIFRKW